SVPSSLLCRALLSFPTRRSSDLPLRGGLNLTVNGRSIWLNIPWLQMLQLQNALFFALIAIMLMVFIGNVIKVGTNRYYLGAASRSEEHTSELQSRFDLVCRLLLE